MVDGTVIEIGISGGDAEDAEQELRSLLEWLRDDTDVRRHATITVEANAGRSGSMGVALEVIKLVLESGFSLGNLALAYAGWRATRKPRDVFEMIVRKGTTEVTIRTADVQEAEKQLRALVRE